MHSPKNVFTLFFLLLSAGLFAQNCTGNLGENIFTDGDFGSGSANILTPNPMIAPGFLYQPFPPPNDGFYTITNDMRLWTNSFGTWDAFPDNSDDPQGYMMIVNAAFSPGKFYEQEVTGLCENTEYQFSADVRNVIRTGLNELLPNVSFEIDNVTQFTTGFIPENQRWNTYAFSFNTGPGQTSVTLSLSNNAPGGNGNDLAIDNISFRACGPEATISGAEALTLCEDGEPGAILSVINGDQYDDPAYQWQQSFDEGETWVSISGENNATFVHTNLTSGFYYYRYLLANGTPNLTNNKCRVVSNEKIVYVVPKRYEVIDTVCAGLSVEVGDNSYTESGTTMDTLISSLGCDSIVTLRLTVLTDPGLVANFAEVFPTCSNLDNGSIELLSVDRATLPLQLSLFDTLQNAFGPFTGLSEGVYPYAVTDRYGCSTSGDITLISPNPFSVNISGEATVTLGEVVRLNVEATDSVLSYTWTPMEGIDCPAGCDRLEVFPTSSGLLRLDAVSRAGCLATDSLQITVVKDRRTYFPSAFSPNGDGINDRFTVQGGVPNITAIEELEVFNRWGVQVFAGADLLPNDASAGWDGKNLNGEAAPPELYVYRARVRYLDGETRAFEGGVVLVR